MAIYVPGPLVGQISGSIGNIVYSSNKGGTYMRNRVIPKLAIGEYAAAAKARMTQVSQSWQYQSDARKIAWKEWAKGRPILNALGQSRIVPGHVAYNRCNITMLVCGWEMISDPPVIPPTYAPTTLVLNADIGVGTFDITFAPAPCAADGRLMVWAALVSSKGIHYVENLYKLVAVSPLAQTSPYDIQAAVTERFGVITVGQVLFVRVARINELTALPSAFAKDSAVVVETS